MTKSISQAADLMQKFVTASLAGITVLGIIGSYQASMARLRHAKEVTHAIKTREQELIREKELSNLEKS